MTLTGPLSRFLSVFLACVLAVSPVPSAQALAETDQTGLAQESEAAQESTTSEVSDESLAGEDVASDDATTEQEQLDRGETILRTEKSDQETARSDKADSSAEAQISTQASSLQEQAAGILKDCAVQIDHDGSFTAEDTGTHVSVRLSDQVSRCNLTLFAYASNTSFDPDSSQNIRLWSGMVTDGWEADVDFAAANLPLTPGYSVIACLNVPITDDYYRACNSASVAIVDENGEGFVDYEYPDAFIVEDELEAGATSLHASVTGDERLFQAAREGKISLTLSVAQYPDGDDFDFESEQQISLCSPIDVTEAIDGQEIQLSEPLRPGYRVRAVVYWSQNTDLFLVKGNDYESVFHRPDDSILVNADATPAIAVTEQLTTNSKNVPIELTGDIPAGSLVLVKKFARGDTIASDKGTPVGIALNATAGETAVNLNDGVSLAEGDIVAAFVLAGGEPIAQSEPCAVAKHIPVTVAFQSNVTTESEKITVDVRLTDPALAAEKLNGVQLKKVNANGTTDTDFSSVIVGKYMQEQGEIEFDLKNVSLEAGQKLYVRVMNYANDIDFFSDLITVADASKSEIVLEGSSVELGTESLTVNVSGCADFEGGRLIATMGSASNDDPDSRTQLGQVAFTGAGSYTLPVNASRLQAGQTVMVHLYKYDSDADATKYLLGDQLPIMQPGTVAIEPTVNIVTQNITSDRTDVWIEANYDPEKVGRLTLYSYEGDTWSAEDQIFSEIITSQANSQRITFGADKLVPGGKLVAVLTLYGGGQAQEHVSDPIVVAAAPEKQKPIAAITSNKVTAGMTTITGSLTFDAADEGTYALYRFTEDTLDDALENGTAVKLSGGTLYRSQTAWSLYMGPGKIAAGDKLQLVLEAGGAESRSAVMTVEPSPDWGAPYVAFDASAVQVGATSVPITVDYADEYEGMDVFYCDVSIYQVPARYSDEEIEDQELWENAYIARRVGQINSTYGEVTRGDLQVNLYDWVDLEPGYRLFIKLRLPHVEWVGEEVDYVSASIPVLAEGEQLAPVKVLLYNLGEDTSRGAHVRSILAELGVEVETIAADELNQEIGYLAGLRGFDKNENVAWEGSAPGTEFMLMCGFGESLLDKFLDAMQAQNLRIDHKAIVTEYNRYYTLAELIGDIENEHKVFQALLALDKVIKAAEELDEETYGQVEGWDAFQEALVAANELLASEEPAAADLIDARQVLIDAGNAMTDGQFWEDKVEEPIDPVDPTDPTDPVKPSTPGDAGNDDQSTAPSGSSSDDTGSSDDDGNVNSAGNTGDTMRPAGSSATPSTANGSRAASDERAANRTDSATDRALEAADDEAAGATDSAEGSLVADDENPLAGNEAEGSEQNDLTWIPLAIAAVIAVACIVLVVRRRKAGLK